MSKKSKRVNAARQQLAIYCAVLIALVITLLNLENYLLDRDVLGVSTQEVSLIKPTSSDVLFWVDFLSKNPTYIPGWIELGRMDKVVEIDPNYEIR